MQTLHCLLEQKDRLGGKTWAEDELGALMQTPCLRLVLEIEGGPLQTQIFCPDICEHEETLS